MNDYIPPEAMYIYSPPAIVKTTDELHITTSSQRLEQLLTEFKAHQKKKENEKLNVLSGVGESEQKQKTPTPKHKKDIEYNEDYYYTSYARKNYPYGGRNFRLSLFNDKTIEAVGLIDKKLHGYRLRLNIFPERGIHPYFEIGSKTDFGMRIKTLHSKDFDIYLEPSFAEHRINFVARTEFGYMGPFAANGNGLYGLGTSFVGAHLYHAILGKSKSAFGNNRIARKTEHVITTKLSKLVFGKTPLGLGSILVRKILRWIF